MGTALVMDKVFRALGDPVRRTILDALFAENGQTLKQLCTGAGMSRQGVSKHLSILETANLVVTHKAGRQKFHYLNPVPIEDIADRWIGKYAHYKASAMAALRDALEDKDNDKT